VIGAIQGQLTKQVSDYNSTGEVILGVKLGYLFEGFSELALNRTNHKATRELVIFT